MRQAPSARAAWPRWTGLASASRTTGAEWKRIPTGKPSARSWNDGSAVIMDGVFGGDRGGGVRGRAPRREAALHDEVPLELLGVDGLFRAIRLRRAGAEPPRELAVELDQLLGDRLPFR